MAKYPDIHDVVNTDSPVHWSEDFKVYDSQKEKLKKLWEDFEESHKQFLADAAYICGLDTSDWNNYDWWDFEDILDDYR